MADARADADRVRALVADQLALVGDPLRLDALRALLVEPRLEEREWDYGEPGERYPFWVVAESTDRGIILAYCEHGFGPDMPWGVLVTADPEWTSLGMDAQWSWYLEEAFVRAGLSPTPVRRDEAFHHPPEVRLASGRRGDGAESGSTHD